MLGPRLPDPQLYVVRNKRKRLALTPVEVDPQVCGSWTLEGGSTDGTGREGMGWMLFRENLHTYIFFLGMWAQALCSAVVRRSPYALPRRNELVALPQPQAEEREQEALVSATGRREGGQGAAVGLEF